jgi:hypothetical protein
VGPRKRRSEASQDVDLLLPPGVTPEDLEIGKARLAADALESHAIPVDCLWPKTRPRFRVQILLVERDGQFGCVSLKVTSLSRHKEVGSAVIRDLNVGALVTEAIHRVLGIGIAEAERELASAFSANVIEVVASTGEVREQPADAEFVAHHDAFWQARLEGLRERRDQPTGIGHGRRYPPGHQEKVAAIVREARQRRAPAAAAVAEVFGISLSAASNQISRAKARGLLDADDAR